MRIGTAGWSIPAALKSEFAGEGRNLQRYARVLNCTEINTSFYRSHRFEVYAGWAAQTPEDFRFSVKMPRTVTHFACLRDGHQAIRRFLAEVAGLGTRLGVILVQLPPSLAYKPRLLQHFIGVLAAEGCTATVALEARHASWFTEAADEALRAARICRVAADPALSAAAEHPGGWLGADDGTHADDRAVLYHRWHGSPRMYWSSYSEAWLREHAEAAEQEGPEKSERWCILDNTAAGSALANALELRAMLAEKTASDAQPVS